MYLKQSRNGCRKKFSISTEKLNVTSTCQQQQVLINKSGHAAVQKHVLKISAVQKHVLKVSAVQKHVLKYQQCKSMSLKYQQCKTMSL
jgi:hypothetical protein